MDAIGLVASPDQPVFGGAAERLAARGFDVRFFSPGDPVSTTALAELDALGTVRLDLPTLDALRRAERAGVETLVSFESAVTLGNRLVAASALAGVGCETVPAWPRAPEDHERPQSERSPSSDERPPSSDSDERPASHDAERPASHDSRAVSSRGDNPPADEPFGREDGDRTAAPSTERVARYRYAPERAVVHRPSATDPRIHRYYALDDGVETHVTALALRSTLAPDQRAVVETDLVIERATRVRDLLDRVAGRVVAVDFRRVGEEWVALDADPAPTFAFTGMERRLTDALASLTTIGA